MGTSNCVVKFLAYKFGSPAGRPFEWFAWRPIKTQSGQWVWLQIVICLKVSKHTYLDGPDWEFFAYALKGAK